MQASPASLKTESPVPASLLALAPLRLPNHRRLRYVGDDLCVGLEQLAARDQKLLHALYRRLNELLRLIADTATTDAQKWEGIQNWIERHDLDKFIDEVREIGLASHATPDPDERAPNPCTMCAAARSVRCWAACNSWATCARCPERSTSSSSRRATTSRSCVTRSSASTSRAARPTARPRRTPCASCSTSGTNRFSAPGGANSPSAWRSTATTRGR